MTLRIYSFLLSAALLVVLNACGTSAPKPVYEIPADQDLPPQTETDSEQFDTRRDPSDRSLAEVAELSNSMPGYQQDIALEILRSLESVPSSQLRAMIDGQTEDAEFTEWLELALQTRTILINGESVEAAAQKWNDYHYGHAVTGNNYSELIARYRDFFATPSRVAILLPTEGGLAAAAKAIRDGILAAYLEKPGQSSIRFYSSGATSESAIAAYLEAREDGATQIIGPLRLESTRALAGLQNSEPPILLLNEPGGNEFLNTEQTININSLSLSQSEETAAIATSALAQDQKQAIMIVPDSAWGRRIETSFATNFELGEGRISAITYINADVSDHSAMLTKLLKIDESKQRKTALQSRIGNPLAFEPSRRDDFDFIFMAANPAQGRELKPLLRFHDAGDIPVYAMGRIYSGRGARASDQDLNGIVFPTTPWQLQQAGTAAPIPDSVRGGAFGNLYALGQDAWHVLAWLPIMRKDPDLTFPGSVGALRLQKNGHLYRQPAWAKFTSGRPVSYQWPATPLLNGPY
jgi:outer membrane PBP1 activator LpoA protein